METLRIVDHLPSLSETDRENPDKVMDGLQQYVLGTVNEIFERREFWLRNQNERESFNDWYLVLKEMSEKCNFARCCTNCESMQLRDRIVTTTWQSHDRAIA